MLSKFRIKVTELQGTLKYLEVVKSEKEALIIEEQRMLLVTQEAAEIIKAAVKVTQEQLNYRLNSVVSLALEAVFPNPYKFVTNFTPKRGTMECDLLFEREGELISPLDDSGYSAADIASFALRVAFQGMSDTAPIICIDEPCKNLSEGYKEAGANMFQQLSQQRKIQMIVVTHIPAFREAADKMFWVKMGSNGVSTVTTN